MKKIKLEYWIITLILATLTGILTGIAISKSSESWDSLLLSGVALITSSIALGLSDKKQIQFKGKIIVWTALLSEKVANENSFYRVSMKIQNESGEPVYNLVYRLRVPSGISSRIDVKSNNSREYKHGKSMIIVDDSYGFLATQKEDGFIPIDFKMQLEKWKETPIYITVSGSNIQPMTFKIPFESKNKLITATQKDPFYAIKIK